ncbi:sugar transferase [Hoeflea sp. WL0058]|uniref:Sugar transferase n=1 Tax=Flavimaribacter sediminis TaxID=2865987 RepID=A0AAE2ZKG6_9HYPH|nr:sugar transferase [Flavimaribacter sediminis]MBW8636195.1 sugar transferase [Flavimaribacter sediminis]
MYKHATTIDIKGPESLSASQPLYQSTKPIITRLRVQLLGALLFCVFLPAVVRAGQLDLTRQDTVFFAAIGATLSVLFGLFLVRRLSDYPGVKSGTHVLISISIPFGLMAAAFLFFRLDYSRFVFIASYILSLVWFLGIHFFVLTRVKPRLLVVPGGNADKLIGIPDVEWVWLTKPEDAYGRSNAIVADLRFDLSEKWQRFIADCVINGVPVYHSKQVAESVTGKVSIEHLSENNFGSLIPNMAYLKIKQLFDLAFALLALPFFIFLYLLVAPVILLSMGRPVFYTDRRIGYRGQAFNAYKFRTMRNEVANEANQLEASMTKEDDARITPFGRVLRKFRIDETPQILNVLLGQMSWIGPRPEAVALSRSYEAALPFYRYRHAVRPGISGWAQVNQGHVTSTSDVHHKLQYDFFYIKQVSPWLDILIVMRTVRTVLSGFGAK